MLIIRKLLNLRFFLVQLWSPSVMNWSSFDLCQSWIGAVMISVSHELVQLWSLSFMKWSTITEYIYVRWPLIRLFCRSHTSFFLVHDLSLPILITGTLTWVRWLGLLAGQGPITVKSTCVHSQFLVVLDYCLSFCISFPLAILFSDFLRFVDSGYPHVIFKVSFVTFPLTTSQYH